ncbi:hypothetical protein K461DRAFT_276122 [Myriangium duriaei CBS 260.36]|uniref:Uncharacterized protein n=1 Tax=Myriangium duriaei CBS 260.36 TaxID=1168546 RepID=A0A9P4MM86_9PEZI|nr:hypothetical protein K461DRAFT_276122 [Myriangium duriaei CBS 260.36]
MSSTTNPTSSTAQQVHNAQGNTVTSADPTTANDAPASSKLKGDFQGAIQGTVGSIQAATGATIRNKGMEQKGLEKMDQEDARLAARGQNPVGSDKRDATVGSAQAGSAAGPGKAL